MGWGCGEKEWEWYLRFGCFGGFGDLVEECFTK